ncbi:MAG: hypothetical protein Q8O29_09735 [Polaromonas sp.]|uniref:hypothetical protein n=1 Tax=Polaromonas sp. TaxID=1869339 RepID=UPI002733558A|nr:hypothetical protein [Polaromonas sp.]MDP2818537.1 hypothetical protein [Polaromonas sp.]
MAALPNASAHAPSQCRPAPTCALVDIRQPVENTAFIFEFPKQILEKKMPIIAWLLGIPISVIILLMLFGVF